MIRVMHILPDSTPSDIRCILEHRKYVESKDERREKRREGILKEVIQESESKEGEDEENLYDYAALSYCWDDPTPITDITVDGRPFRVAQNLLDFLKEATRHLKLPRSWWIDAICINQEDTQEKSEQVQHMWRIYSNAANVYAWLGKEQSYTSMAFATLRDGIRFQREKNCIEFWRSNTGRTTLEAEITRPSQDAISAIIFMFDNPYFSRVWIVQEVLWAKDLVLFSGSHRASLGTGDLMEFIRDEAAGIKINEPASALLQQYDPMGALFERVISPRPGWRALVESLEFNSKRKCTDPRDKIFAALNLPRVQRHCYPYLLKPDYSMTLEETAAAFIAYVDSLPRRGGPSVRLPDGKSVRLVQQVLNVDCNSTEFQSWLWQRVQWSEVRRIFFLKVASGVHSLYGWRQPKWELDNSVHAFNFSDGSAIRSSREMCAMPTRVGTAPADLG